MRTVYCVQAVSTSLGAVDGISSATVKIGSAELEHAEPLDESLLRQAVDVAGYVLTNVTVRRSLPLAPENEG